MRCEPHLRATDGLGELGALGAHHLDLVLPLLLPVLLLLPAGEVLRDLLGQGLVLLQELLVILGPVLDLLLQNLAQVIRQELLSLRLYFLLVDAALAEHFPLVQSLHI